MIEALWRRHYHEGVTGSYHGDMAYAFSHMLGDFDIDGVTKRQINDAIRLHMMCESNPSYTGRKWFCELFGTVRDQGVQI